MAIINALDLQHDRLILYNVDLSLGTLLPNSRDWYEKWQLNFLHFKAHLKISFSS